MTAVLGVNGHERAIFTQIAFGSSAYESECILRQAVLRAPLNLSLHNEDLSQEKDQWHFGLLLPGGELLACVVAIPLSSTAVRIRQMAVSPPHQRQGLGRRLMQDLEIHLRARGFTHLLLHARASAVGFYEGLRYSVTSDEFEELTLPHFRMGKSIQRPCAEKA